MKVRTMHWFHSLGKFWNIKFLVTTTIIIHFQNTRANLLCSHEEYTESKKFFYADCTFRCTCVFVVSSCSRPSHHWRSKLTAALRTHLSPHPRRPRNHPRGRLLQAALPCWSVVRWFDGAVCRGVGGRIKFHPPNFWDLTTKLSFIILIAFSGDNTEAVDETLLMYGVTRKNFDLKVIRSEQNIIIFKFGD